LVNKKHECALRNKVRHIVVSRKSFEQMRDRGKKKSKRERVAHKDIQKSEEGKEGLISDGPQRFRR